MSVLQKNKLEVVFVDQVKFHSLLHILMYGRSLKRVYYFESITPFYNRMLAILRNIGLICADVYQVNHHIGQARYNTGSSPLKKVRTDSRNICSKIRQEQLKNNPLINAMGLHWNVDKVILEFEQMVEREVHLECLRIRLFEWLVTTQYCLAWDGCALLIERKKHFQYLKEYADSKGVKLKGYAPSRVKKVVEVVGWFGSSAKRVALALLDNVKNVVARSEPGKKGKVANETAPSPKLAIRYCQQRLSFKQFTRSAFFWIDGTNIPYSEILLYDYAIDRQLDEETQNEIKKRKIKIFGTGPGVRHWRPSNRIYPVLLRMLSKYVCQLSLCFLRGKWISPYYIVHLLFLVFRYSYWYDFFTANNVHVNVTLAFNGNVAQVLALDDIGGVSAIYQYTMSDIDSPSTLINSGEDLLFAFSPVFESCMRKECKMPVKNMVYVGYLYDNAFKELSNSMYIKDTRKQLQDKGAKFILCFLDENSWNKWYIPASDEEVAEEYEFLLKWLLADPSLGMVFKPKAPKTLFKRITRISELITQVMQTGRCIFLTDGVDVSSVFPSQAAMIADVCVGKLCGSTAALESRLAGIPTLLIDVEGVHNHPFYVWSCNKTIHSNWDSIRTAVEQYRAASGNHSQFGKWSSALNDIDPFQDGQASFRMGFFLGQVYETLKEKKSKQTSIEIAREKFAQRWGSQYLA